MSFPIQAPPLAQNVAETKPKDDSKKGGDAHKVGQDFEAILVRQMLSKANIAGGGTYGDMAVEAMASAVTKGGGLGLGRVIEQQLSPHQATTSAAPATPAAAAKALKKASLTAPSKT